MTFFWYVFPVILLFISAFLVKKLSLETKYGIKAPDLATPFLLVGIHHISKVTFEESFLPYVLLMILLVAMIVAVFQAYQFKEIKYKRYIKMLWRIIFLITLLIYVLLIIVSIIMFL
ncbi:MAG: DUF3397 domain-containing protein [Vagococcus sp.]